MAFRRWRPPVPVVRTRDGGYELDVTDVERDNLVHLLGSLSGLVESGGDNPRARRLFPVAYHDLPDDDAEFHRLMRPELVESTKNAIALAERVAASREPVSEEEILGFMRALNSLRLVMGTMLDVGEDDPEPDPDGPDGDLHLLYAYVGWLLEATVDAVSDD